ncbi:MAG: membrane protein insertase YidC [Bacteroidaceae bacterium]|nr:membrane protein insertase YidC [Bacteroidaceae bacterium]
MDKNSIIGFALIGIIFVAFFQFNKPDAAKIEAQKRYQDSIAAIQQAEEQARQQIIAAEEAEIEKQKNDSSSIFFNVLNGEAKDITIANNKVSIDISTLGARVTSATLADYTNQEGGRLTLFSGEDNIATKDSRGRETEQRNQMYFTFDGKNENIDTKLLYFTPRELTDSSVVMRLAFAEDKYIDFAYRLLPDSYMLNLAIDAHNMQNFFHTSTRQMGITWEQLMRQQEKGFKFEQQYSTVTYKIADDDTDYLSEMKNDEETLEQPVDWVAFKNQFFSCIMIAGEQFNNVYIESDTINEGKGYLKNCYASMNAPFDPSGKVATDIQFYFGPNKYSDLVDSNALAINGDKDLELQKLIYFGWPIVRWINRFFIMYLFDWLNSWGMNMGIVLLLLTLIVKAIVYPFTYKSYISSAKMRALKPYIEKINAKYTKKEDALKKQQETMALYSQYGASPMGGCLPMLIQMPVFIAMFNFVPNAIELRQESFLWANDLSSYDALISWNTSIWPIGNHISLFCLLFCVTQILNTYYTSKMQPSMGGSPEQEQQAKIMRWMMYLMPIMFFFIFNDYSSGLNYYYFVSTLISVLIFIYLRRTVNEDELLRKMEAYNEKNKNNPKKQSNFMARLEALQEQQRRMLEEQQKRNNKK